jgi:hypothetical protein
MRSLPTVGLGIAAICVLASAGCDSQPAQDAANATGPYLCAPSTHPTSLAIVRSSTGSGTFSFPSNLTVEDVAQVTTMATALCALTREPAGVYHCGPAYVFYALAFSTAVIAFRPIELGTGACATVSGLDAEGTRIIQSATVWSNLATALNLSPATEQSFAGTT